MLNAEEIIKEGVGLEMRSFRGKDPTLAELEARERALFAALIEAVGPLFPSGEGLGDDIEVGGLGYIAVRDLLAIFRPKVHRPRRHVPTEVRRKATDRDLHRLFGLLMTTLPDQQLLAVLALIDGRRARTYSEAARLMRVTEGTVRRHLNRVRRFHPELWAMVMAMRAKHLARRHSEAVARERRRSDRWFSKRRRMERKWEERAQRNEELLQRAEELARRAEAQRMGHALSENLVTRYRWGYPGVR